MFCIDLGDFPLIPFDWFITLQNMKPPFCVLLTFGDLVELKWSEDFSGVNIFPETQYEKNKYQRGPTRPERAHVVRAPP
jgi:hypothetical protein